MKEDCRGSLRETWYEPEIILRHQFSSALSEMDQFRVVEYYSSVQVKVHTGNIADWCLDYEGLRVQFKQRSQDKIHRKVREMELKEGITGRIKLTSCVEIEMLQLDWLETWNTMNNNATNNQQSNQ